MKHSQSNWEKAASNARRKIATSGGFRILKLEGGLDWG